LPEFPVEWEWSGKGGNRKHLHLMEGKMKRIWGGIFLLILSIQSGTAMAKMGSGQVTAKSSDVDIQIFGSLHTYPTFVYDSDFNRNDTVFDAVLDEGGWMAEESIRSEARIGLMGTGENWSFLTILEADFTYSKANADRGANKTDPLDSGMTGEDFGIEKLELTYDFGPFGVETGWQTKALDIKTGGLLYGDDHPYLGLMGKHRSIGWEALYLTVQDDIENLSNGKAIGALDADTLDWRVYSGKVEVPVSSFTVSPFYAYSDNDEHDAEVHYLGLESYGKYGLITPRAEFVYALGNQDATGRNSDIAAWGAFAAVEVNISPLINPYLGGYYVTGDDSANDDDIDSFNPITNISRYTPVFGLENAFIYRYVPVLGNHLYSNVSDVLGATAGYGGIGNSAKTESPGMMMLGAGCKGVWEKWQYKTQLMYFWFENTGALEDLAGTTTLPNARGDISEDMGLEYDLQITYNFNKHFSLGNVFSIFVPGDGVQDLRGEDYDQTAFLNTVEAKWEF
jgi:hypothetical protein